MATSSIGPGSAITTTARLLRSDQSAAASWIARQGALADTGSLRDDLERAIREASRDPAKHPDDYIDLRVRDLDPGTWFGLVERH